MRAQRASAGRSHAPRPHAAATAAGSAEARTALARRSRRPHDAAGGCSGRYTHRAETQLPRVRARLPAWRSGRTGPSRLRSPGPRSGPASRLHRAAQRRRQPGTLRLPTRRQRWRSQPGPARRDGVSGHRRRAGRWSRGSGPPQPAGGGPVLKLRGHVRCASLVADGGHGRRVSQHSQRCPTVAPSAVQLTAAGVVANGVVSHARTGRAG